MLIEDLKKNLNEDARHFVDFPEVIFFDEFSDHVEKLDGAKITEFAADGIMEMWLEFDFFDNHFFVNNSLGDYQFYVQNPECPDEILLQIADHFRKLLEKKNESFADNAEDLAGLH